MRYDFGDPRLNEFAPSSPPSRILAPPRCSRHHRSAEWTALILASTSSPTFPSRATSSFAMGDQADIFAAPDPLSSHL